MLDSAQRPDAELQGGDKVLVLCANNYLGLADDPRIIAAARNALDRWGYGMASVRFICGTQEQHKQLEHEIASFLGTEDTILYSSCFDANGGLFETLLGAEDAVISDELNHASIIDGIRLVARRSASATRIATWRIWKQQLKAAAERALPHDRHRRRVFDGRLHRAAARDLRPGGEISGDGDGGRFARRGLRRAKPDAARTSTRE